MCVCTYTHISINKNIDVCVYVPYLHRSFSAKKPYK